MFRQVFNILFGKEDSYYEECLQRSLQRDAKIRDIRRRIEEQRSAFPPARSFHIERHEEVLQPEPNLEQAQTRKEQKNRELEDIKAKLTRRKSP